MKKLKNLSYAVAAFVITTTATSCKKSFLDEENPHTSTAENMWTSPTGFLTLVNSAYQELHQFYGIQDGTFVLETGTDLGYSAGRSGFGKSMVYYDNLLSTQGEIAKNWASCYKSINLCNAGIARIDQAGFSATEKAQRLGELRFLRALYNFHLVEQWGGVTLRLQESAAGAVDYNPKRSTPEAFYDAILADLQFAKDNLPVSWPASDYSRAAKKSAMGLLAEVLLQRAYYSNGTDFTAWITKAKDAALEVINGQAGLGLSMFANANEVGQSVYGPAADRAKNKEAMFVLSYDENAGASNALVGANGNRIYKLFLLKYTGRPGMSSTYVPAYGTDGEGRMMPTWHLLDLYNEKADARYNTWFQELFIANQAYTWSTLSTPASGIDKDATVAGKTINVGDTAIYVTKGDWGGRRTRTYMEVDKNELYVNPVHGQGAKIADGTVIPLWYPSFRKFVNQKRTFSGTTDFGDAMIIRLSEMYLIAAEAYLQLNDKTNAAKYINEIRSRRAIPGQEANMVAQASEMNIDYILDERGRELVGELHRWYDLKRIFRSTDWVAYVQKWNPDMTLMAPYHRVRPIPSTEMLSIGNATEYGQNDGYK